MSNFKKYWLITLIGTILLCAYPIYMGVRVVYEMATQGAILQEHYPKYTIPYVPIAIAVIAAVALMPLIFRLAKKFSSLAASLFSLGVFFVAELLFESRILVTTTIITEVDYATLEGWQLLLCARPVIYEKANITAIDLLIGNYSPTFKIHFYMISAVLILGILNCLYGFAQMIRTKNYSRRKALTVQAACTAAFLGLCILACFTAFFRDGRINVSPVSAILMCLFFALLGVTAGIYVGSFLLGRKRGLSVLIPALTASIITLLMYIGEMFLLGGYLYRYGYGFFFAGIPHIVLAPVDLLVILLSGAVTAGICYLLNKNAANKDGIAQNPIETE